MLVHVLPALAALVIPGPHGALGQLIHARAVGSALWLRPHGHRIRAGHVYLGQVSIGVYGGASRGRRLLLFLGLHPSFFLGQSANIVERAFLHCSDVVQGNVARISVVQVGARLP